MKATDRLIKGDKVLITDGSYAVRVDKYEEYSSIGLCKDIFEVMQTDRCSSHFKCDDHMFAHDIIIKNTVTGLMYLHSKAFVKLVPIKTLTLDELEEHFKCDIRIELEPGVYVKRT